MLTGRKYKLLLTDEQAAYAEQIGGACRAVWNTGLHQRREYRTRGAWMNYGPQCTELADAKREHAWLANVPGHCLQQTLKDLDAACRTHGTLRVRWRSKRRWAPSFRFPEGSKITVERLGKRKARAKLPKLGWVLLRWSRHLNGQVRSATLARDGTQWFVSFLVEDGKNTPDQHERGGAVGVERGVAAPVACSDGTMRGREFTTPGEARRYRRLQQQLSRQQKGSANREKTKATMRRLKRRERDRREDFTAWAGSRLATAHGMVIIENLPTKNMTASATGTVEAPGTNVRQKAGLNRAILDKGWHKLELAARSAARYTGARVVKVPAPYTSQRCSRCRRVEPESRESQAVFRCTTCGHHENADVNAAKNVLADGLSVSACGDSPSGGSAKQELAETREVLPLHPAA